MDRSLEMLCTALDEEVERQELVLSICTAQQEALRAHDLEALQARTEALETVVREAAHAEAERHCVLREVVEQLALPVERETLSGLVEAVPEPWCGRLKDLGARLRETVSETRRIVQTNRRILKGSLRIVDQCLQSLDHCHEAASWDYTAQGLETLKIGRSAVLLDQKG